ncbi:MAG TPA: phosphatase PAP2-related protein, partial [Cyclobacteriaceae bacterium]
PILNDYLLNRLPAYDLSFWIFLVLYIFIFSGIFILFREPSRFLYAILAYLIITLLRFTTLLLVPLDPPINIIELRDPLVQYLFYQQSITKDLFFSGHTSIVILLGLAMPNLRLRILYFTGAAAVAVMLLLQHAHYTVDIVAAPFFAWISLLIAQRILRPNKSGF